LRHDICAVVGQPASQALISVNYPVPLVYDAVRPDGDCPDVGED